MRQRARHHQWAPWERIQHLPARTSGQGDAGHHLVSDPQCLKVKQRLCVFCLQMMKTHDPCAYMSAVSACMMMCVCMHMCVMYVFLQRAPLVAGTGISCSAAERQGPQRGQPLRLKGESVEPSQQGPRGLSLPVIPRHSHSRPGLKS